MSRHGAAPWRMAAADYLAAVRADSLALAGTPHPTPWDPALADAMAATGKVVYEESVTETLITDLRPQ